MSFLVPLPSLFLFFHHSLFSTHTSNFTMLSSSICPLLFTSVLLFIIVNSIHASTFNSISAQTHSIFGIRGGAFFGFGKKSHTNSNGGSDDPNSPKRFPPLTREEIEDKLSIPIYGITDLNGNGVILSDGGDHIFHFFLNREMAEQASVAVRTANENAPELKIGVFHLGKCWFRLIENSGKKVFTVSS